MVPRKDHGSQEMTYSIPISWQSSTLLIPKIQRHVVEVVLHDVGVFGLQEQAVERGVLSRKHQALPPISDPNHRSSDHTHLTVIHQSPEPQYKSTQHTQAHCLVSIVKKDSTRMSSYLPDFLLQVSPISFVCSLCSCVFAAITYLHPVPDTSSWKLTPSSHDLSKPGNREYLHQYHLHSS